MQKKLLAAFIAFIAFNGLLIAYLNQYHSLVPFSKHNYITNAHHYLEDPRAEEKHFNLLSAIAQYDAQWYLKIANEGYTKRFMSLNTEGKTSMDRLSFAFFPLYPILLYLTNLLIHNIEFSAFLISNIFLIVNFFSLFSIVSKLYSQSIALKTIFLLFLFPFSIFYRSYFTEGLYLFLLLWASFFLIRKKFFWSTICFSLLNITKANGFLLNFLLLYYIYKNIREKHVSVRNAALYLAILAVPLLAWMAYCFIQTGNPLYFYSVRSAWSHVGLFAPFYNLASILIFPVLPFHSFHLSQIEVISVITTLFLLVVSKKLLKPQLWWVSFLLWASPLLVTDLMSFSRYQTVSFPLYIFLALSLKSKIYYAIVLGIFSVGLLAISLFFINWYWIG